MRLFMIYPNQWATGNKPIGIASLAATLKRQGHAFKLFDFTQFDLSGGPGDRALGERSLEFRRIRNPERLPPRRRVTCEASLRELVKEIELFRPDLIGLSVLSDDYPLGLLALQFVRQHVRIPTIVGGVHAAVDPEGIIQEGCVDFVCIGEGEGAIAEFAGRFDRGEDLTAVENMWGKTSSGIVRNPVRPLIQDLDTLPYPDWTIYPETAFYKPYDGYVYKYGDFEMSRGCPYTCSYCINVELQQVYKGKGSYHREKSVARVIQEISWFKERHGIEFLKFWDETFLLMSPERLEALAAAYHDRIGIPFAIETTASTITPKTAALLQKFGCATASLGLETGNVDLRKGVLDKNIDDRTYEQAYRLLREHGVRGVSFNMIGLPFERREDIFDTIRLNKRFRTEAQSVGIFYPYKGTPMRTFCESKGLLDAEFESRLLKQPTENFITYTRGVGSVLKLCDLTREELIRLRDYFSYYVVAPEWLWPLVDACGQDTPLSRQLSVVLCECLYQRKYHGEDVDATWPKWLEPFTATCDADAAFARAYRRRLMTLWESRDGGLSHTEGSPQVPVVVGLEEFNRSGHLEAERLSEIRQTMRELAKQDVSMLFSHVGRSDAAQESDESAGA